MASQRQDLTEQWTYGTVSLYFRYSPELGSMKSHREFLTFNTSKRRDYINITADVEKAVEKSKIKEGLVLVSAMHITAGVYINDAE